MARLRLFGHPAFETAESRKTLGLPPKGIAVIALVTADGQSPLSRDSLARKLWPGTDPARARANLRRQLYLVLKLLGDDALTLSRETVQWNAAAGITVDVVSFDALRTTHPAAAVSEYAGEFCAGVAEAALEDIRLRYSSQYEKMLRALLEQARAGGDDAAARNWLERLILHDPLDEQAVRDVMQLQIDCGDRAGALREYTALRGRLLTEIGAEPQPETQALIAGAPRDDHDVPHNLPGATTSFVGREREIAEIEAALQTSRMVTLVGAAGAGKSRLAVRCSARLLPSYGDGVWFVDFEHARSESDAWELLGNAVRAPAVEPRETSVLDYLSAYSSLIVLDTCEHVLAAAERVAMKLLARTGVHVLAISRHSMRIDGTQQIAVGAMDAPAARQLFLERATAVNPAFRLDQPREISLAQLLQRVDGLPLAVELLASRANVLTIEGMRTRLAQTLHSPIAQTLAWSYDLLSKAQRGFFASLSVFRGAFTLDDVECVQGGEQAAAMLSELVNASLVSRVATANGIRYRLLETTRDFAWRRLRESTHLESAAHAHAQHFARKAGALAQVPETEFPSIISTLADSMPDYQAAFEYAAQNGCGSIGVHLIEGLYRFALRGHFTAQVREHAAALFAHPLISGADRARIARLAAIIGDNQGSVELLQFAAEYYCEHGDEVRMCDALNGLAATHWRLGNFEECERLLLDVRGRMENGGDKSVLLKALGRLVTLYTTLGGSKYDQALARLPSLIREFQEMGEVRQATQLVKNLAASAYFSGRFDEALTWARQALELTEKTSELAMRLNLLTLCGSAEQEQGNTQAAAAWHLQACQAIPSLGELPEVAESLEDMASTVAAIGLHAEAATIVGYADHLRRRFAFRINPDERDIYDRTLARLREALGARLEAAWASGARSSLRDVCSLAMRCLMEQASCAAPDSEDTTSKS